MARTFVQQSQISGSLAFNDTLEAGSGLAYKQTIVGDLDALRSQVNKIIGGERWYDALSGSQDLADIYAAVHMSGADADFQGALGVTGVATFDSDITGSAGLMLVGDLDADGNADFAGDVNMQSRLDVAGDFTAAGAVGLSASGLATNVYGDLVVAEYATFDGLAAFNADVTANKISIDGATTGRLYLVGASGEIAEEANLTFGNGSLSVTGGITGSAGLQVGGEATIVGSLTGSFVKLTGNIDSDGDAAFAGGLSSANIVTAGIADIGGVLEVAGVADFAAAVYMASSLGVSGSLDVAGPAVMSDGLTVSGDRLEVTGSFGLTGAADLDSTLNVDGVADFKSAMYVAGAAGLSGSLDVAGAVDLASTLAVAGAADLNGALDVAGIADFQAAVYMAGDLGVSGSLTVAQAATLSNGLTVNGAAADFNADVTANKISIDSDVAERLYIVDADGSIKDESKLTFDGSTLAVDGDISATGDISAVSGSFSGDLTVAGDLVIQGSMTYIDTENLKVKDTLIHLNVAGNSNLSPRGIVLHGDQAYDDLAFGAKPASGDFVLAKEVSDADVDAGNSDVFAGAKLAAMWMGEIKLGGIEGSLSGSFAATAAGAELSSTAALSVAAADDLALGANGEEIGLMSAAEKSDFDGKFDATSVVGALVELFDMIGGGSAAKGDLSSANVAAGVLTFSSVGTLTAAEHKLIDVYLNGVLLSPSRDLSSLTTTTVTIDSGIASGLIADDVITVVIRSAA